MVFSLLAQSYLNQQILARFKRKLAKNLGYLVKNSEVFSVYQSLVKQGKIKKSKDLENLLRLKKVRSLSGIVPIAVLTKPYPCPGNCLYCPSQEGMPKSYLDDEPAVMRASLAGFDPYLQVKRRISQLQATGHSTDKIELIVMGGTFTVLPESYKQNFIKGCFDAANAQRSKTLTQAQKLNQTAKNRIIGLTLETRPDQITIDEIKNMRQLGATRVEIGVQTINDSVLTKVNRGHGVKETIKATRLLKDAGFKVNYHLMPNLPGSSLKQDFKLFKTVFTNHNFKPDMIKIYPCVVLYQAQLYQWFKQGKFKPYSDQDLINLLLKIKKIVPPWIRIMRLGRDIPVKNIAAGNKLSNIRQILQQQETYCQCIRCREIKQKTKPKTKLYFKTIKYQANGGQEYFLQYVDKNNKLYAMLRLRIPSQIFSQKKHFIKALENASIIRELHTYGKALAVGKRQLKTTQHQGLGKKLLKRAEVITKNLKLKKIAVISGIGVRQYYQNLGYQLQGNYMVKNL